MHTSHAMYVGLVGGWGPPPKSVSEDFFWMHLDVRTLYLMRVFEGGFDKY